jgi:hypothetical protein
MIQAMIPMFTSSWVSASNGFGLLRDTAQHGSM